ncbi:MAG: cell division protein FtsL [Burkholderiaceae bacterium]|nr:cell division protein FtsL [Burkholderiaceae bacterium]
MTGPATLRLNLLLAAALLASALLLVKTSYESRRLVAALDRAQAEQQALESERQRLESERQAQATPLRVERVARERLAMRTAGADVTLYVELPGGKP